MALAVADRATAESHDISFHLNEPGQVSIAVYDSQERMLRELGRGEKMESGEHRLSWDGLDRYGQPAPAGQYEWRLLRTPGFTREFLVNVGTNPGWTPFDLWPGNHAGPTSLMVDSDTDVYVASVSSEGPPHLLKMSADGRRKFWDTGTWGLRDGLAGMARIGELLYLLFGDGSVDILRADSGARFAGPRGQRGGAEQNPAFPSLAYSNGVGGRSQTRGKRDVIPMALGGGRDFLVVTYQSCDQVRFFWPKDGIIVRTNAAYVKEPKGCCVARDGRVFVVSGKSVVQMDPETGKLLSIVTDPDLVSPTRIAYDPANDDLLVVEHGENLDNVRRYHATGGNRDAIYGRRTGRVYGVFNPLDYGRLLDIAPRRSGAVDGGARIFVDDGELRPANDPLRLPGDVGGAGDCGIGGTGPDSTAVVAASAVSGVDQPAWKLGHRSGFAGAIFPLRHDCSQQGRL